MKRIERSLATHLSWRPSAALKKRFERFLEVHPPCDRTQYLEVALTYYLDSVAKHGMNLSNLFPKK